MAITSNQRKSILLTLVHLSSAGMFAQDSIQSKHLNEVSVLESAHRANIFATSLSQTFSEKELRNLGLTDVASALRLANGISIKDYGGLGGMKTVSVRNLGAEHTGVLYDGVPISNCQAGQIDISRFSTDALSSIKMGIGAPSDLLMPASAEPFSGTLLLTSSTDTSSWLRTEYGSFNTIRTAGKGVFSWKKDNAKRLMREELDKESLSLYTNFLHTDGDYPFILTNGETRTRETRQNGEVNAVNAEINFTKSWNIHPATVDSFPKLHHLLKPSTLNIKAYYYYNDRGLPGGLVYYNNVSRERLWEENAFSQVRYTAQFSSRLEAVGIIKYNHAWNRYFDGVSTEGGGITMHTYNYRQDETLLSLGINYRMQKTGDRLNLAFVVDEVWNGFSTNIPEIGQKHRRTTFSSIRARYRDERIFLNTAIGSTIVDGDISHHNSFTPSASMSFRILRDKNIFLRASWRKAFRLPSFNDLYYYRLGNHTLRPECTTETNLGMTTTFAIAHGELSITADAFWSRVKDKIVAQPTTFAWKMSNFGRVSIHGANIAAELRTSTLSLNVGYNYNDAKERTALSEVNSPNKKAASDPQSRQIPYTAQHSGNASVIWINKFADLGYSLSWMGERHSTTMHERRYRLHPYDDHSLSLSRRFSINVLCKEKVHPHNFDLGIKVENLLDRQYEIIQFYPMPGRCLNISLKIY